MRTAAKHYPIALTGLLCLALTAPADGQGVSLRFSGQAWASGAYGSDPVPSYEPYEGYLGYIPTLTAALPLGARFRAELVWSVRLSSYAQFFDDGGDPLTRSDGRNYRLWLSASGARWELRLGRQKIAFGPGQLMRPLAWFDKLDLRDPTGQTRGVDGLRGRLFPAPNLTLWGWLLAPQNDGETGYSPGGRVELLLPWADIGFTFHSRTSTHIADFGQIPTLLSGPETRLGFDLRTDKIVGFWIEGLLARGAEVAGSPDRSAQLMAGLDYTLPWGNGVLVMAEHLLTTQQSADGSINRRSQATVLIASIPFGLLDRLMAIVQYSHENNFSFQFILWQRSYDHLSLNMIAFANPTRSDLGLPGNGEAGSLVGLGTGVQLLLVYHH